MSYSDFLDRKRAPLAASGFEAADISEALFPFQAAIVRWGLRLGRFGCFAGTGSGKTIMELECARQIQQHRAGNRVLILAPLGVAKQMIAMAGQFGYDVRYCKEDDGESGIIITNYERVEAFGNDFEGVILDESGILKSFASKTRRLLTEKFAAVPYRSCWTATPAPNDWEELGNTAEFLGVKKRVEMLATYFTHDGGDTAKWRLKGHGEQPFFGWLSSWCVLFENPSEIGFPEGDAKLPALTYREKIVNSEFKREGELFAAHAAGLQERSQARKHSTGERVTAAAAIVAEHPKDQWIIWCGLNRESELATAAIPGAVEVTGSDSQEHKERVAEDFASGKIRVLVTKGLIFGWGMNFQNCRRMVFLGLSDSWELFYQSVRRCWRRGQTRPVFVDIVISESEGAVLQNIHRKETQATALRKAMVGMMTFEEGRTKQMSGKYETDDRTGKDWHLKLGDCVERIADIESDTVGYTIFSPPFASLYTYTDLSEDMGNAKNDAEFYEHFGHLVPELYRVTMPGRLLTFHCANVPAMRERDGFIGLKDFRGDLIRLFQSEGWIFHSEVMVWKDPLIEATRTKALGLLHKQVVKDSCKSRQGIPDFLITMRKPGENPVPVSRKNGFDRYVGENAIRAGADKISHYIWQRYASPVWVDIVQSDTLNVRAARENKDERHICPLQLGVIERCLELWTTSGDLVLSPFAGIGSEGHQSVLLGRKFVGIELKRAYFDCAVSNLTDAEKEAGAGDLFASVEVPA